MCYVSVVLICYNYAHLLPRVLGSIAEQTFTDYELILVNNGSTDNTAEVFDQFVKDHPEISCKIVYIEVNKGPANGDNEGASKATGEYLMFVDADDWMDPNCLECLTSKAKETDADRVIGSYRYVNQNGETIKTMAMEGEGLNKWFYTMQQCSLFKRSVYVENGIRLHDILFLDAEKTMKFSAVSKSTVFVPTVCYNYYVHESTSNNNKMVHNVIEDTGRFTYTGFIDIMKEVFDSTEDSEKASCLMQIVRLYYSFIMLGTRGAKYRDAKAAYRSINGYFKEKFPDYCKELDMKLLSGHMGSRSRKILMRGLVLCERMHIFGLALFGFLTISKFHYIST